METAFECWLLLPQYSQKIYVTGQKGVCSATAGTRHLTLTRAGSGKKCWYQTFSKDYFKENFGLHIFGELMSLHAHSVTPYDQLFHQIWTTLIESRRPHAIWLATAIPVRSTVKCACVVSRDLWI